MRIVETTLGNEHEENWKLKLAGSTVEILELDQWDAQKNRFKKKTAAGNDVAISLERGKFLRDGDILCWDEKEQHAIVARIKLCEVMVLSLNKLTQASGLDREQAISEAVRLGHALGNQHWPAVIANGMVYVPMSVARPVMESVMKTHHLADVDMLFSDGEQVLSQLDQADIRKLFGGAEQAGHGHIHLSDEDHVHDSSRHAHGSQMHSHPHSHPHSQTQPEEHTKSDHAHWHYHDDGTDNDSGHIHAHSMTKEHSHKSCCCQTEPEKKETCTCHTTGPETCKVHHS